MGVVYQPGVDYRDALYALVPEYVKIINDHYASSKNPNVYAGDGICPRCKEKAVFQYTIRVRSGDEGDSFMKNCDACHHRWITH